MSTLKLSLGLGWLLAAAVATAQQPPAPAAAASAPIDKRVPKPRSASELRDDASPPGELRPENPVVPQLDIKLGRTPPTAAASKESQARAQRAAATDGVDDAAARCLAQSKAQDRARCRATSPRPAASAPRAR